MSALRLIAATLLALPVSAVMLTAGAVAYALTFVRWPLLLPSQPRERMPRGAASRAVPAGMNALICRSWLWVALVPYALPLAGLAVSVFA
jgi:hypothetical protein